MQIVINSPGTYITQKDGCFQLKNEDKRFDISPQKVESIIISNKAMITSQAVVSALENNIDIVFLDGTGSPIGRIWFAKMGSTALIRRNQLAVAETKKGFELIIDMIRQKMENQSAFLKKLMYARPGKESYFTDAVTTIENAAKQLIDLEGKADEARNTVMGLEGTAGRAYFQSITNTMPEKYRFNGRSRQPAKDPFNAVLNYCYGILYSTVEKACILAGLDPYVGFLHTDNYNKKSFVFDMIEPFRIFAEQNAVYLFTGKKMKDEYFTQTENAVSLNTNGKPVVVEAMNKHLDETVRYRRKKRQTKTHHPA